MDYFIRSKKPSAIFVALQYLVRMYNTKVRTELLNELTYFVKVVGTNNKKDQEVIEKYFEK